MAGGNNIARTESYSYLITAVTRFRKENLEIMRKLIACSNAAVAAMNGDERSEELKARIDQIVNKMITIDEKAAALGKGLSATLDELDAASKYHY